MMQFKKQVLSKAEIKQSITDLPLLARFAGTDDAATLGWRHNGVIQANIFNE